jgi:hypothetical protein
MHKKTLDGRQGLATLPPGGLKTMKRVIAVAALTIVLAFAARPAAAVPDDYDDTESYPLRVAAYLVYPVGYALEWAIFRPFHYLVSRPALEPVFGHRPHGEFQAY